MLEISLVQNIIKEGRDLNNKYYLKELNLIEKNIEYIDQLVCEILLMIAKEYYFHELFEKEQATLKLALSKAKILGHIKFIKTIEAQIKPSSSPFEGFKGKEAVLLTTLLSCPTEKYDLIEAIYGLEGDIQQAEKSFKALLGRVRKKLPGKIVLNLESKYQILQ